MRRSCARTACSNQPTATLSYDYANRMVWLEVLSAEAHPMTHDLCTSHADRVSVPLGWHLSDHRGLGKVVPLPFAQAS
ncbi:MAG: DUF3499 family protein [Acidimicrobiia bacterium]